MFEQMFETGCGGGPPTPAHHHSLAGVTDTCEEQPMRTYDDPVEVRRQDQTPDQFLWRGRLWQVREVVSHWVETGAWWLQGSDDRKDDLRGDLLGEREIWRVAAARGRLAAIAADPDNDPGFGVFDLSFDWASGDWRLAGAVD